MSVSVADIMKLPSMAEARVAAGFSGLKQTVSSITVMESDDRELIGTEILGNRRAFGSEIVIAAFMTVRNDVKSQCETLRRLKLEGEIAMILFYVGAVLPEVSRELTDTADEISMPLIVMPENRLDLRYSDVICDVMEAIIRDKESNTYFATELIERLSHIQADAQSMGLVLAMIRDRTQCSLFLTNETDELLNSSEWPNYHGVPHLQILEKLRNSTPPLEIQGVDFHEKHYCAAYNLIKSGDSNLYILVVKEKGPIKNVELDQICYVIKTYLNLWTNNYGKLDTKQLISAVLHDEPEKMQQIAKMLSVDISIMSYTYFLYSGIEDHDYENLKKVRGLVKEFLKGYKNSFITDIFDETIVIITDPKRERIDGDLPELLNYLKEEGFDYRAVIIDSAKTTKEVKDAYWLLQKYREYIPVIFLKKMVVTGSEMEFVKRVKDIFDSENYEVLIERKLQPERFCEKEDPALIDTLQTYFLDGDMNMVRTAEIMFVHVNTVKYRMKALEKIIGHKFNRLPEGYDLYQSLALYRLKKFICDD